MVRSRVDLRIKGRNVFVQSTVLLRRLRAQAPCAGNLAFAVTEKEPETEEEQQPTAPKPKPAEEEATFYLMLKEGLEEAAPAKSAPAGTRGATMAQAAGFQMLQVDPTDAAACRSREKAGELVNKALEAAKESGDRAAANTLDWIVPDVLYSWKPSGRAKAVENLMYEAQASFVSASKPHLELMNKAGLKKVHVLCIAVGSRASEEPGDVIIDGIRVHQIASKDTKRQAQPQRRQQARARQVRARFQR